MNFLDILVTVIGGYCLVRGIFRGFFREISSIVGVLGGFYAAYMYYPLAGRFLSKWVSNTAYLNILSFFLIFCTVFLLVSLLGTLLKHIFKVASVGWFDRFAGAGFGLAKAVLISAVVVLALTTFLPKGAPVVKDSLLAPYVTTASEMLIKIVPDQMKEHFLDNLEELRKAWEQS
ncbi:CvpA family protein [Thermodesulfobacteriota bacterium]